MLLSHFRALSAQEVEGIIALDYSKPSDIDIDQATILLNTWLLMVEQRHSDHTLPLIKYLQIKGLRQTITDSCQTAWELENDYLSDKFAIFSSIAHACTTQQEFTEALQLLQFPKRFTYNDDPSFDEQAIEGFKATNRRIREFDTHSLPVWFRNSLHEVGVGILGNWKKNLDTSRIRIPNGATFECPRTAPAVQKYQSAVESGYIFAGYPVLSPISIEPSINRFNYRWQRPLYTRTKVYDRPPRTVNRLIAVPKNYKAKRTIATEEAGRQILMGQYEDAIRACYKRTKGRYAPGSYVTLNDQSRNRQLARLGSVNGKYATIDCTAASDSLSYHILEATLPADLLDVVLQLRANYCEIDGQINRLYIMLTMGSRLTFPLESHVFWCIAMVTRKYAALWFNIETKISDYSVYGDDCIVPSEVAELFCQFLELAGFIVNHEKTYITGNFRESCGLDCYQGADVSARYWPRRTIDQTVTEDIIALIKLQHRLVGQYPLASDYLTSVITSKYDKIAYAPIGHDSLGLWASFPPLEEREVIPGARCPKDDNRQCVGRAHALKVTRAKTVTKQVSSTALEKAYAQELVYRDYLLYGPQYSDPLLELLGVSEKRDPQMYLGKPEVSISTRFEVE